MRDLSEKFRAKTIEYEGLLDYGFRKKNQIYIFEKQIQGDYFKIVVEISNEKQISKVIDLSTGEGFVLVDVFNATGDFVGKIKDEYESVLNDILEKCTTPNIFQSRQAKEIIQYVKEKYGDDLEYLWKKFPNNAVWRNKKNNKWYGALLVLSESKLGIESDRIIDIIDLRYQKDRIHSIIDHKKIFAGYHMNKSSWITIRLDGSINIQDIFRLIDNSYQLSIEK